MITQLVRTADGHVLSARFFEPQGEPRASVLLVSAMGASQQYYAMFARWLATQGYLVATFDYRGTGLSRSGSPRDVDVDIIEWGRVDCTAMVDALKARLPDKPLYWVGHSLGGQLLAFTGSREKIAKAVTIATGSGYWRENTPSLRWRAWWLWYVVAPLATRLCGYFPGRRLRKVGDLPARVMNQWRRWCRHPDYAVGAEGAAVRNQFAAVTTPMTVISFTDDEMMSARNTESIHGFYVNAPKVVRRIAPREIGVPRIGHFGFFRKAFETLLWKDRLLPELR